MLVDGEGRPKVVDFGIARAVESDAEVTVQTQAGQILGTLGYKAPEQLVGEPDAIDSRCDVYALGAMLYEGPRGACTPRSRGRASPPQCARSSRQNRSPWARLHSHLAGDLQTVVHHAIEKDPERRYPTCLGVLGRVGEQRELILELTHELDSLEDKEAEQRAEFEALGVELRRAQEK